MLDKGKYDVFGELFTQRFHQLYVHAFGYVENEECAKDIVHDAIAYLWEHFDQLEQNNLLSLLYRLVRNQSIDYLRHNQASRNYLEQLSETSSDENEDESIDYERYEALMSRMRKGIEKLPPKTQRVFIECVLHKKSYKEVAEQYSISPLTVKTLVARALKIIRNQPEIFSPILVLLFSTFYAFL